MMNHSPTESDEDESATVTVDAAGFQASIASFAFNPSPRRSRDAGEYSEAESPKKRLRIDEGIDQTTIVTRLTRSTASSPGPSPKKKKKRARGYATPETYAHLRELQDILSEGLDVVFCGINPGQKSAEIGHHFGHPTNHFWGCLHESGLTLERLSPEEDHTMPERFSLGLTNLVDRATAEQSELSAEEQAAGVPAFLSKVARYRPRVVCFIGLGIAKVVHTQLRLPKEIKGVKVEKPKEGLQVYKMVYSDADGSEARISETLFYAIPSTSGRVVTPQRAKKVEMFANLKLLVEQVKQNNLTTDHMHAVAIADAAL
ncbi:G/T mismatch-specific thymine DNA glycosylase [Hypsizygus marmoreus]|uniref:G/T mismatch-specific thymine DNA glycosylase n=1 Tax=Hypsizygus marmoreus TaxID=39966 RepID=A0A369J953_HYPMA|nr:G/T mismatch-specific thymine DNA glycosylase [Hypsizygus marmoreus]